MASYSQFIQGAHPAILQGARTFPSIREKTGRPQADTNVGVPPPALARKKVLYNLARGVFK